MPEHETPQSVSQWAEETFGPAGSNFSVAVRANRELGELLSVVASSQAVLDDGDTPIGLGEELADVVIVLWRLASRNGIEITQPRAYDGTRLPLLPDGTARAVARMNREWGKFLEYVAEDDQMGDLEYHVSRLVSACYIVAERHHLHLQDEIDAKMKINRSRKWNLDGDGHGYHVKE